MSEPLRIAMWSGPRNISTALMRSFENRPDCAVIDEPLYGAWLKASGARHPMRAEIMAAMDCDWQSVVGQLTGPVPGDKAIWYQKHMTHHLMPEMIDSGWLAGLRHVFLIRDPRLVVASYLEKHDQLSPDAIGIPQQQAIYDYVVERMGRLAPIIDSGEFLANPEAHLRLLCEHLKIPFDAAMLRWPPGRRDSDGVWASHWYQTVEQSTGFGPPPDTPTELSGRARAVAESCMPLYKRLFERRLKP